VGCPNSDLTVFEKGRDEAIQDSDRKGCRGKGVNARLRSRLYWKKKNGSMLIFFVLLDVTGESKNAWGGRDTLAICRSLQRGWRSNRETDVGALRAVVWRERGRAFRGRGEGLASCAFGPTNWGGRLPDGFWL